MYVFALHDDAESADPRRDIEFTFSEDVDVHQITAYFAEFLLTAGFHRESVLDAFHGVDPLSL